MEIQSISGQDISSLANGSSQIASSALEVLDQLQSFVTSSNAPKQLDYVYDITNFAAKSALMEEGSLGDLNLPKVHILSEKELNGVLGAYSPELNTIYLDDSLLAPRQNSLLKDVLLEEMGHYFDTLLNPGEDTQGDEGELLKSLVTGNNLEPVELERIRQENDWTQITVDNTNIWVEQDNSLSSATNLGTISGKSSVWVGGQSINSISDPYDYYRFYVNGTSRFNLSLSQMTADADVQLLNSSGSIIASSTNGGSRNESISRSSLSPGTYYVKVYSFGNLYQSSSTNYALNLWTSGTTNYDAGNSTSSARNLGDISSTTIRSLENSVNSSDTNDYYRFRLTSSRGVGLQLYDMSADADLQLLNSSGSVIASSTNGGSRIDSISPRYLSAGTYYARVYPHGGASTRYTFKLTALL